MRSFKEFLEEELISEDDDKKEDKKESKKDSEKKSEKKDDDKKGEDKKEDKKEEEEINLDMNDGYSNISWKTVFSKKAYDKHMKTLDKDDDEHVEKIEPMVYVASFGKNYQAKFESVVENDTAWVGSLNKGIPSGVKEQGLVLSTIMDILDDMSKGEPDADFEYSDIQMIRFGLTYNNEEQLKVYKKMAANLHVSSFSTTTTHRERRKKFSIVLTKN
ncbi:MAG: hypothetical protein VW270_13525 [Candidatus Poseidoniales archaeon]